MIIQLDMRENELLLQMNILLSVIPLFKDITIEVVSLPIGDVILYDEEKQTSELIIERKSISDLSSSIKDGRYEEQSYRLNGLDHPNHNIMYIIEGDVNKMNRFKDTKIEKLTIYSAIFSLNYYKGFSVMRTFSVEETAIFICNTLVKMKKERNHKQPFYKNNVAHNENRIDENQAIQANPENQSKPIEDMNPTVEQSVKDYVNVVKKVKKENVTPDNISEIMLCQIPSISSVSALAIMNKFKTIKNMIKCIETDPNCLSDITIEDDKGKHKKINKNCSANILKYLQL